MRLINSIKDFLIEADKIGKLIVQASNTKPIADAIKNRRKISFYYSGPRKPKKNSVLSGKRIMVEPVAMGLNSKGRLIIRAWVEPPSTSKKGFEKTNWRTFILNRARNIEISDEVFNEKRPGYKEGEDGSMTVTYVTSDWTTTPKLKKYKEPLKPTTKRTTKEVPPKTAEPKPEEPKPETLPQPKPKEVPPKTPEPEIKTSPEKNDEVPTDDIEKFPEPKPEEKPVENPEDETDKNIQESIKRIKTLMYF